MISIDARILKAAMGFQAKNDARYYLNGIHLNKNGTVEATDGHSLIVSECGILTELDKSLIINIHGAIPAKAGLAHFDFVDEKKGIISFEKGEMLIAFSIIDGTFPDTKRVMPTKRGPVLEIGFNPDYILKIQKGCKILNPRYKGLEFHFYGKDSVTLVRVARCEFNTKFLLMPMRT